LAVKTDGDKEEMVVVDGGKKTAGSAGRCATLLLEQTKMGTANVCLTEMSPNVFFVWGMGVMGQYVPECRNLI
jgi:hypothetical protein